MDFYSNSMMFNYRGQYDPSGDSDYNEDVYLECWRCYEFVHPSKGQHDKKINFYCNECIELNKQENK